jgi:hypothetical protein
MLGFEPAIGDIIVFKLPYSSKLQLCKIHAFTKSGCPSVIITYDEGGRYFTSVKNEFLIYNEK